METNKTLIRCEDCHHGMWLGDECKYCLDQHRIAKREELKRRTFFRANLQKATLLQILKPRLGLRIKWGQKKSTTEVLHRKHIHQQALLRRKENHEAKQARRLEIPA